MGQSGHTSRLLWGQRTSGLLGLAAEGSDAIAYSWEGDTGFELRPSQDLCRFLFGRAACSIQGLSDLPVGSQLVGIGPSTVEAGNCEYRTNEGTEA